MTPIERGARALSKLDGHPENAKLDGKPLWASYIPEATAVIKSLRKPSTAMIAAAVDWAPGHTAESSSAVFGHMIDAALSER